MRRTPEHFRSERRGVAAVEMALVLPIFMVVSLGIVEYGRALMAANMVTNAAREGGRIAGKDGSTNTDVQNAVTSFLTNSLSVAPNKVTVNITITPAAGNPNPQNQCANARLKDLITVEAKVPFSAVSLIPASYLKTVVLSGRSHMLHE